MTKGLGLHHSPYGHIETVAQASAGVTGVWCWRNADPPRSYRRRPVSRS